MSKKCSDLQKKLLDMLGWFHQFCAENQLRYYVLGGTMLGAARHQGFIPWDDDVDVGMPRADYERLASLMQQVPAGRYVLETPHTEAEDYFYPISKLYDTQTTLVENTRVQIKRGIYLDIFPLDGIGNSLEESRRNYKPIYWKFNLLLTRVTGLRKGRSRAKNLAVAAARLIPQWILNDKKLLRSLDRDCARYAYDSCSWVGNLFGAWRFKEVMPKEILGEPTLYRFEELEVYGPQRADEYLSYLYGDWRQLPPEEKRVSHHDFVLIDLERSYLEETNGG